MIHITVSGRSNNASALLNFEKKNDRLQIKVRSPAFDTKLYQPLQFMDAGVLNFVVKKGKLATRFKPF